MPKPPSKSRQRTDRMLALFAEPSTFDELLSYVVEGGTVYEWCREKDIRNGDVRLWAAANPDRTKKLADAEASRLSTFKDQALMVFRSVATADIRTAFDKRGNLLPPDQLPDALSPSISGVEHFIDEDGNKRTKIKFTPRERGAELLGRHLSMFKDNLHVEGPLTVKVLRLTDGDEGPDA